MSALPALILLHGARGFNKEFLPFAQALTGVCAPTALNMVGHGGREIPDVFTLPAMAQDVLSQMDALGIKSAYFFGYSIGGYLALYLARHAPERVLGVCTLATKFVFDVPTVKLLTHLSRVDRIQNQQKESMDERHPDRDWSALVSGLADLYRRLGEEPALTEADLARISVPTLTVSGNKDQLVPWGESLKLAYLMPKGQGFTFAGQAHPFEIMPVPFLASIVGGWLKHVSAQSAQKTMPEAISAL